MKYLKMMVFKYFPLTLNKTSQKTYFDYLYMFCQCWSAIVDKVESW